MAYLKCNAGANVDPMGVLGYPDNILADDPRIHAATIPDIFSVSGTPLFCDLEQ